MAVGNVIVSMNFEGTTSDFTFPIDSSVWVVAFGLNSLVYHIIKDTVEHSSVAARISIKTGAVYDLLFREILD